MNLVEALMDRLKREYLAHQLKALFGVSASTDLLYKEIEGEDPGEGFFRAAFEARLKREGSFTIAVTGSEGFHVSGSDVISDFLTKFRANMFAAHRHVWEQVTSIVRRELTFACEQSETLFNNAVAITADGTCALLAHTVNVINPDGEGYALAVDARMFRDNKILLVEPIEGEGANAHDQSIEVADDGVVFTTPAKYVPVPFEELQVNKIMQQRF